MENDLEMAIVGDTEEETIYIGYSGLFGCSFKSIQKFYLKDDLKRLLIVDKGDDLAMSIHCLGLSGDRG